MKDAGAAMVSGWLAGRSWQPFKFQREVWQAIAEGRSGMLHATTGSGKTYAVWLGMLAQLLERHPPGRAAEPLRVVWLTPMRALASDTTKALTEPLAALAPTWTIGQRTGDTPGSERARQDKRFPTVLVTTPESLTLMLTRDEARTELQGIEYVVVDEWHELIGSKRGVQAQLALARLRRFNPKLVSWGLSATLGNLEQAMQVLCGPQPKPEPRLVRGKIDKALVIDTLIPP
ncbi:MAG: DEAD/DEAH box helicase, partial [Ramlibacter sp.]